MKVINLPELQKILDMHRPQKHEMITSSVRGVTFEYKIPITKESSSTRSKVLACA